MVSHEKMIEYSAKNKLIIRWNHQEQPWTETVDWRLEGGLTGHRVLQSADLNHRIWWIVDCVDSAWWVSGELSDPTCPNQA